MLHNARFEQIFVFMFASWTYYCATFCRIVLGGLDLNLTIICLIKQVQYYYIY